MKFEDGIFGIIFEQYTVKMKRHEGEPRNKKKVSDYMKNKNEIYGGNLKVHEICVRD
jgi:hypothetical protein